MGNKKTSVADNLVNFVAGLGTNKDKKSHGQFKKRSIDDDELEAMYSDGWLSGKVIDIPVEDMVRKWRSFTAPSLEGDKVELLKKEEKRLGVKQKTSEAQKWARLYGGSAWLLGVDGQGKANSPLDVTKVQKGQLKFVTVHDRTELAPYQVAWLTKPEV